MLAGRGGEVDPAASLRTDRTAQGTRAVVAVPRDSHSAGMAWPIAVATVVQNTLEAAKAVEATREVGECGVRLRAARWGFCQRPQSAPEPIPTQTLPLKGEGLKAAGFSRLPLKGRASRPRAFPYRPGWSAPRPRAFSPSLQGEGGVGMGSQP